MRDGQPKTIYLKDYSAPTHLIDRVSLRFELDEQETLVSTKLAVRRNPGSIEKRAPLVLHGHSSVELRRLCINGQVLSDADYSRGKETLTLPNLPEQFELEMLTRIEPQLNTALEGLYKSAGVFCTQCEAEGFRRITFYPDRPDVMALFETTIVADKQRYPVLLSNGNAINSGEDDEGRHWVTWQDPFPKPAYLFALVAGDLSSIEDSFTTQSGSDVKLQIFADAKDHDKLGYAMESLKQAMRWDEEVYGREYDLDIYMIVAVDFFNMGAMENKGLNIFNTSCVLASQETTTDAGFQRVEGVVAHEYFHNWSGNRVTCRDWFQLSLKEGFTVFRDSEFSADMNSRTVKRIEDVTLLRTSQFAEDAGPMAHPVRPNSFIEISNFYTLTVYEKGAEVVRMIHQLLGAETFRRGTDLYFERHDGQAVTTDDFVAAMAQVSGRDFTQFKLWYDQAGTPRVDVSALWDPQAGRYTLKFIQSCPPTAGQPSKRPFHMPVNFGLIDPQGKEIESGVIELTQAEESFSFDGLTEQPIPSLLRGFSAPVKLAFDYKDEELLHLMLHDTDGFNQWEAGQRYLVRVLQQGILCFDKTELLDAPAALIETWRALLQSAAIDPAMLAKMLTLPSEAYLSELSEVIEVEAIHGARESLKRSLASALEPEWLTAYHRFNVEREYQPTAEQIASRSMKSLALSFLLATEKSEYAELAERQFEQADNMTDQQAALSLLVHSCFTAQAEQALASFREQWQAHALVMNNWFAIQASDTRDGAIDRIKALELDPLFDAKNPNKLRSLIGAFVNANPIQFHANNGVGYSYLADWIVKLNEQNPQVASRMLTPLTRWKRYPEATQQLMRASLQRVMDTPELSPDVFEVVSKSLV